LAGLGVSPDVRFVLVIEKDAIFRGLSTSDFVNDEVLGQSVIITGKGFPDVVTRELVHNLADSLEERWVWLQASPEWPSTADAVSR
jgi:meiotic recombination protein SPO11